MIPKVEAVELSDEGVQLEEIFTNIEFPDWVDILGNFSSVVVPGWDESHWSGGLNSRPGCSFHVLVYCCLKMTKTKISIGLNSYLERLSSVDS